MMVKGFFVTGTDTGVGKTIIAAALIRVMRARGIRTCGMKPVETGCCRAGGLLQPADGMFLKRAAGMEEPLGIVTPCCFETPAAPLVAAEREGVPVDLAAIRKAFNLLCESYESVVVEGVGGILVPITRDCYLIDLIKEFGLPVLIVSKPSLGTINHTLLTVSALLREEVKVAGIVINWKSQPDRSVSELTNPNCLERLSPVPVLGRFPHLGDLENKTIERAAIAHLDIDRLLQVG